MNLITRKLKKKGKARWSYNKMLIDWVGGPDGKIFGPRSWRTFMAYAMTSGQIYVPVRPSHSVNKYILFTEEEVNIHHFSPTPSQSARAISTNHLFGIYLIKLFCFLFLIETFKISCTFPLCLGSPSECLCAWIVGCETCWERNHRRRFQPRCCLQ